MEKFLKEDGTEIYLFKSLKSNLSDTIAPLEASFLNEFIAYLKFCKVPPPHQFSYVSENGNLLPELTLMQNILLDYSSPSLTEEKEVHLKKLFKSRSNFYLESLYGLITNLNELAMHATHEEIKLATIIRAMISDKPFLFFEMPETYLSENTFRLFVNALKIQSESLGQKIFLKSNREQNLSLLVTKIVTRNMYHSFDTKNTHYVDELKSEKAKFYQKEEANQSGAIVFHLPNKKKAA
jgi:hypothetical protein